MKTKTPTTPIQRPATPLEQARDQMLVALDRAVNQGNILHCLPVVQRARAQADHEYAAWLAQLSAWEEAIDATRRLPVHQRGGAGSPLVRKGETGIYPQGGRIVLLAQEYDRDQRARFCDLPESEQNLTDDELERALQRLRAILAAPPPPPAFEVSASLSWSPKIGRNRYADLSLIVQFPEGGLDCTPSQLNHLFRSGPLKPQCEDKGEREVELYVWACPEQFSLSSATRLRTELEAINHPFSPRPLEMCILTADLAHLDQLTRAKIGVIAYDQERDAIYIPEAAE